MFFIFPLFHLSIFSCFVHVFHCHAHSSRSLASGFHFPNLLIGHKQALEVYVVVCWFRHSVWSIESCCSAEVLQTEIKGVSLGSVSEGMNGGSSEPRNASKFSS